MVTPNEFSFNTFIALWNSKALHFFSLKYCDWQFLILCGRRQNAPMTRNYIQIT